MSASINHFDSNNIASQRAVTSARQKFKVTSLVGVPVINDSSITFPSDQSSRNCHSGNNDDKSKNSSNAVFGSLLNGLVGSIVLTVITGLCVWRWRFHHLENGSSLVRGVHILTAWIEPFHRDRSKTLMEMGESNHKDQTRHRGILPPISIVECSQFIHHSESSSGGDNIGSTSNGLAWVDPYEGRMPPHIYTLPNPSPQNVRIGLYGKEYQFVQTEVNDPSSHQTHMAQRKMLEILSTPRWKNGRRDKTTMVQVGGQIGWFTMQAAAIGVHVHVLEANPINILRICRNIQLNQINNNNHGGVASLVHLYHVSVMDEGATESIIRNVDLSLRLGRGVFAHQSEFVPTLLQTGKQLQQQAVIYPIQQQMNSIKTEDSNNGQTNLPIPQVTLDAWATQNSVLSKSDVAGSRSLQNDESVVDLLKIDVLLGQEIEIVYGARQLLKSHKIRNILMDIQLQQQDIDTAIDIDPSLTFSSSNVITKSSPHAKMAEFLIDNGYQVHDKHAQAFLPAIQGNNENDTTGTDSVLEFMNRYCRSMGNRCHLWWKVQDDA